MKKSRDISKFDIHWQMFRMGLKKQKTHFDKARKAEEYLLAHANRADKERILNYLEGLAIAYKDNRRADVLKVRGVCEKVLVSNDNIASRDFSSYEKEGLNVLFKDLFKRSIKWLRKGYRHHEQIAFVKDLGKYLGLNEELKVLDSYVEESYSIKNSHTFFF